MRKKFTWGRIAHGTADLMYLFAAVVLFVGVIHAQQRVDHYRHLLWSMQRQLASVQEGEITCLTNVVYHEARNQNRGTRGLMGRVELAAVNDPSFRMHSVCADAQVKGRFSFLKNPQKQHFDNKVWKQIYLQMQEVYFGPRTLPRGWECARDFRASDKYLESRSPKAIQQLGFTRTAAGLKYFASKDVPVGTPPHSDITFYAPRGGCENPTPVYPPY